MGMVLMYSMIYRSYVYVHLNFKWSCLFNLQNLEDIICTLIDLSPSNDVMKGEWGNA